MLSRNVGCFLRVPKKLETSTAKNSTRLHLTHPFFKNLYKHDETISVLLLQVILMISSAEGKTVLQH